MRLTLRTLLAYLDDTLEPLEIKTIGQKVAESDTAQELIARIKQVTRRRRITTPPATGPHSFEPNQVAEYLDNELSAEGVAELEKICLESDVHLAEVASCHQILTLVLGEPAVVPPTAKERMYALVRGREAIPFRKATTGAQASAPHSEDADADEMFLLGLRRSGWMRWALPIVALLLFAIGGVALWQSIHGVQNPPPSRQLAQKSNPKTEDAGNKDKLTANPEPKDSKNASGGQPPSANNPSSNPTPPEGKQPKEANPTVGTQRQEVKNDATKADDKTGNSAAAGKLEKAPEQSSETTAADRKAPPSEQRQVIGKYYIPDSLPISLLVQLKDKKEGWKRLKPGTPVSTVDPLMSLPGYASELRLDCGLHLLLRGHVREFTPPEADKMYYLQESAIVLHAPKKGTDADLTLERGRLYLSNHKSNDPKPLVVRLRFEQRVWDLTLQPQAEIVVDLIKSRSAGEPLSQLILFLLDGEASIVVEGDKYPELTVPGWAQFFWASTNPTLYNRQQISKQDLTFAKSTLFPKKPIVDTEEARKMKLALNAIRDRMTVDKPPLVALKESLDTTENFFEHQLALCCFAAMDEIKDLLDVLGKADQIHAPDRDTAIFALRRWLDHGAGQDERLFNKAKNSGVLLSDMGYTTDEAERFMALLGDPAHEQVFSKEYYEDMAKDLASKKVAIAELARWRLTLLAIRFFKLEMPKLKSFNAARPHEVRAAAMQEVLNKVSEGQLPPSENRGKPAIAGPQKGSGSNPQQKQKR